jgi:arginine N-succinyltransferase
VKIIRPITRADYSALYDIAVESGIGFTSLPVNESLLTSKIERAEAAFQSTTEVPGIESYLFVMEDTETGEVVGTSGIEATVGLDDAFYSYHVSKVVHASRELNVHNTVELLTLCSDYTGVSEICTLFLRESARSGLNGKLLSKMRFLFMAEHKHRFADTVIAEMRGISDEAGRSPFWEWLEKHFFSMDFPTADYLSGIGKKVFIAELMPKYPIYVNLLSEAAQNAIGKVHEKTAPALRLLQDEGFMCRGYVDIFDGGPTVEANVAQVTTVRNSKKLPVKIVETIADTAQSCFAINTSISNFRACTADLVIADKQYVEISQAHADALAITDGDSIRFCVPQKRTS